MTVVTRLARISDLDAVTRIEKSAFDPSIHRPTSRRQYRYLLTKGNADILLAENENGICGCAVIFYRKNSSLAHLYAIAVSPDMQSAGVGRALFRASERHVGAKGKTGIICEIRTDNHVFRYAANGYKKIADLPRYFPDGCDGIKLRKIFSDSPVAHNEAPING
ncbi:MAG: N-acetyltransferase [Rickettsiales bacterium]